MKAEPKQPVPVRALLSKQAQPSAQTHADRDQEEQRLRPKTDSREAGVEGHRGHR